VGFEVALHLMNNNSVTSFHDLSFRATCRGVA
jgi:hypothetical protein